jgi:Stress responsive A/B Barrel Domain
VIVISIEVLRMFVHAVYFWFMGDLTAEHTATVVQGIHSLTTITTVHRGFAGVPASTDRPVIDRSYSYALIVIFKDQQAHDLYQTDPIHDRFRELCSAFWEKVVIYDSVG